MPTATDTGRPPVPASLLQTGDDPYLLLKQVLHLRRAHFRSSVELVSRPRTADDCLVVASDGIRPYHLTAAEPWANYDEIAGSFTREPGQPRLAHTASYSREFVFAPVKVVVGEQDDPLRAAIAYESLYLRRGKIGVLRPGQPVAMAYCAIAVLNSAIGTALYHRLHRRIHGAPPSEFGVSMKVLEQMPVCHREAPVEQVRVVARLAHQLSALCQAEREIDREFYDQSEFLWQRLLVEVGLLLKLRPGESQELLRTIEVLNLRDARQPGLFDTLGSLPPVPPLELLSDRQLQRHNELLERDPTGALAPEEIVELRALNRLLFWQDAVNASPPWDLRQVSEREALTAAA